MRGNHICDAMVCVHQEVREGGAGGWEAFHDLNFAIDTLLKLQLLLLCHDIKGLLQCPFYLDVESS